MRFRNLRIAWSDATLARRLIAAVCFPFVLLLLPFIALGVGIIFVGGSVQALVERVRWIRALRSEGRVIAATVLVTTAKGGTLIVNRPSFNFKSSHCWWTNENVPELSPVPIPTDDERMELIKRSK